MSPKVSADKREHYLEERRNQILDAATVDEIAKAIGISKGTIYLYFKSKNDIFDAILAERSYMPFLVDSIDTNRISIDSPGFSLQSFLEDIGLKFLNEMGKDYPLFRLILADAHRYPVQAEHVYNNLILKANIILTDFLTKLSEAGKIRKLDSPLITARCLVGMLIIYVLSQEILGGKKFMPISHQDWIKETVRLFLEGIKIPDKE
jgi:TetR/AcrR family transcriptional regulator of autoinduction and epiphytic fitness